MTFQQESRDWAVEVAREFSGSGWSAVEIRTPDVSILLTDGSVPAALQSTPTTGQAPAGAPAALAASETANEPQPQAAPPAAANTAAIEAPGVGVFWGRPKPGDPPFVEQGQAVEVGQTVGLLEVMKMFTEITATKAGTVEDVLADGTFVEFGQAVMHLSEKVG